MNNQILKALVSDVTYVSDGKNKKSKGQGLKLSGLFFPQSGYMYLGLYDDANNLYKYVMRVFVDAQAVTRMFPYAYPLVTELKDSHMDGSITEGIFLPANLINMSIVERYLKEVVPILKMTGEKIDTSFLD